MVPNNEFVDEVADRMARTFDQFQLERLRNVLILSLQDCTIEDDAMSIVPYDGRNNEWYLKQFIVTKKSAGLADKTLKHYNQTLAAAFLKLQKDVTALTTDDIIGYQDIVSKAHKQRRIYFPKLLVSDIRGRCGKVYICESRYGGQYTTRGVSAVLQDCAKGSGVPKEVLHPHSFRHFFAKMFLKSNNDITLLGDLLGHSNISTTAIYTRKSSAEQAQELDRIIKW